MAGRVARVSIGMNTETPFRISLTLVLVLTAAVSIPFRLKAAASGEKISHADEGYAFAATLRLIAILQMLVLTSYLASPSSVEWSMMPVPDSLRWLGVLLAGVSSLLMYWTLSSLGRNLTDTVVIRSNATLVTDGPYRWVRHPFYFATACLMGSVTLVTANWVIGLGSLLILAMLAIRTPKEELRLIERFGVQYTDYMARTPRFFPRLLRTSAR